jgi:hypothetical protein
VPSRKRSLLNRAARMSLVVIGLTAVAAPAVATASTARPAGAKKISSNRLRHVGQIVCAQLTSSTQWVPGTSLSGYFVAHENQAQNYAKLARKAKGKKRQKLNANAERYRRLAKGQQTRCYFPASPTKSTIASPASTVQSGASTPSPGTPSTPDPGLPGGETPAPAAPPTPLRFDVSGAAGLALGDQTAARATGGSSTIAAAATTTASNLVAVDETGRTHDAVASGSATISQFLIAANNKVYVVFSTPVDLDNASPTAPWTPDSRCLIAVIDPASGVPTCIDSRLGYVPPHQQGGNALIQYGAGAIYYRGFTTTGKTVLRRYLNGVATDLINDNISLGDFLVRQDGSVFITGSSSTGASWTRRITPSGGLQNIRSTNSTFLRAFPDGNVYMGFWNTGDFGVRRYETATSSLDPKFWIGSTMNPDAESYFSTSDYCSGGQAPYGFCGWSGTFIKGTYQTSDDKIFAVAGGAGDGVLMQYYPDVSAPATAVTKVSVAQSANNNLLLAGHNDQDQNVLTLYNTATGTERQLLGPDNEIEIYHLSYRANGNKVLFDGLRFADNKYVFGQVDLTTSTVTVSATTTGKWADFQTFG